MRDREEDQNAAMSCVEPILPVVYNVLSQSVSFYFGNGYSDEARADHTTRAMANCIYSHAEKRMFSIVDEAGGISLINVRGLYVLNYKNSVLVRFKKVNGDGRHSNYQTRQQEDYDDQKPFPEFPEPAFRLVAGYQLDDAGSALQRVMIARPLGRSVFWTSQVNIAEGVATWQDITPQRLDGTTAVDFDAERARKRRGRRGG